MKMNIKGLVFVGFAAAVFAGAAQADPTDLERKTVTSKPYVDSKIVQTVGESDETHAPSGAAVHAYVKDSTIAIRQGTSESYTELGSFTLNDDEGATIYVPSPAEQVQSNWDQATSTESDYIKNKPTITNAASGITNATGTGDNAKEVPSAYAVQQYMATNQANWTETTTTSPSYIQNKPGNFGGANGTAAGTAGFVPAPAATANTKFLKGDGTWADIWTTPTGLNCTASTPCALVNAGNGAEWQYIQQ